ncbi:MAG: hypothetical protein KDE09_18160, partial [Anaerolineales bacterium]|nr:hypothetical protein [Anaerolineales bacterium]
WSQNEFVGQYDISTPWTSFALASGDSWSEIRGLHPDFYIPNGQDSRDSGGGNTQRLNDAQIGEYIDTMAALNPDDPENVAIVTEFLKYWIENMYDITAISFKKFVTWDSRYWVGFPTAEQPDFMPLYWFQGGKYAIQSLEPAN